MCYCILIHLLNSQCSILSRSAFTLPCGIRIDFHWASTQDLPVPGHLVLSAEVSVIWTGSPFRREETSPGQVWALMWHPEPSHLALQRWWLQGWLKGQAMAGSSLSRALLGRFWREHCTWWTWVCQHRLSFLLFLLLPMVLRTGAALLNLLQRVLDSPLLANPPLFLASCGKLEGLESSASRCQTAMDGETVRPLEWCQTKAFEWGC